MSDFSDKCIGFGLMYSCTVGRLFGAFPDPLGWFNEDKDKVRGRHVETNNGRRAMLGIFILLAESKAPGAVPPLAGLIPEYSVVTWSH
jgi:hypothetical protein